MNKNKERAVLKRISCTIYWVLLSLFFCAIVSAEETPVFFGNSPPIDGSSATLVLNEDPASLQTFQWSSSDSVLGDIETGEVSASVWNYYPAMGSIPARIVFSGQGDGARFRANVLLEEYSRAVVDVIKGRKRVRYLLTDVRIEVFRDVACTKVLDDWPQSGSWPRSPKYLFGKEAPICIRVKHKSANDEIVVKARSQSDSNGINITLKKVSDGVYQSRAQDASLLFLADKTQVAGNGRQIHVIEEELLSVHFQACANVAHCGVRVMVDRGECAAATPKDEAGTHTEAMEQGFVNAASAFMDEGCLKFDAFTTKWWNVGKKLRAPANNPMTQFIRDAGSNDAKHKEADILFISGHSNPSGALGGGDSAHAGNYFHHFAPARTNFFRKTAHNSNPFINPGDYYFSATQTLPSFTSHNSDWNEDLDWVMMYSCQSLNDQTFDIGDFNGGVFNKVGSTSAWKRWIPAFTGNPRGIHGIMGYKGNGSASNKIVPVINNWVKLVKQGRSIAKSWLKVTKDNGDAGAVVFIRRNLADTIDSMQRDPQPGEKPIYWSKGMTDRTKKKILKSGKFKAGGKLPNGIEIQTVYDYLLGDPKGSFAGGQCDRLIDFPNTLPSLPRLLISRNEVLLPGAELTLESDGSYRLDRGSEMTLDENTVSGDQAKSILNDFLANNFASLPASLELFGLFPGVVETEDNRIDSGFDILLEQRYLDLTVFNSHVDAELLPDGQLDVVEAVLYDVSESGVAQAGMSLDPLIELAGLDLLVEHPEISCNLTDMQAYYAYPLSTGQPQMWEVRPVWAVEFNLGEVVYIIDAITGEILERDQGV